MVGSAVPDFDALAAGAVAEVPGLTMSAQEFARHLETIATRDASIDIASLRLGDLYLAWCCSRGCPHALERFWTHHVPAIRHAAASVVCSDRVDDVVQDVLERVLVGRPDRPAAIESYEARSKLGRWLRATTVRAGLAARDRFEAESDQRDDATDLLASTAADPELELLKQRCGDTVEGAVRKALASLDPDERLILQQHLVDGLAIDQLATIYRIHRATAARRIAKANETLRVATRRYLREATQLLGEDLDTLMRFAQSRVQLSLRSLVVEPAPE